MTSPEPGAPPGLSLVLTTAPDEDVAESLVRTLVEERLIACGNLVPGVISLYRWEGDVSRDREVLIVMKTEGGRVEALFERIADLHPYEVPELVALPAARVAQSYCDWVIASTKGSE